MDENLPKMDEIDAEAAKMLENEAISAELAIARAEWLSQVASIACQVAGTPQETLKADAYGTQEVMNVVQAIIDNSRVPTGVDLIHARRMTALAFLRICLATQQAVNERLNPNFADNREGPLSV